MPATLFDKIWDPHVVADLGAGWSLLYCDRVLIHDLSGGRALQEVGEAGYAVARPDLVFATPDHAVSSAPGSTSETLPTGARLLAGLRKRAAETGVRLFDLGQDGNGIVHVMAPELGIVLPGTTLVCGFAHIWGKPVAILANNGVTVTDANGGFRVNGTKYAQRDLTSPIMHKHGGQWFQAGKYWFTTSDPSEDLAKALQGEPVEGLTTAEAAPATDNPDLISHTTQAGKVIRGVVRTDLSQDQAKAVDPYTFKKNGG